MHTARAADTSSGSFDRRSSETLLKAGALQSAIFNSANFSSIATDADGVIQIFNVGAERMLGYTAEEVVNKVTLTGVERLEAEMRREEVARMLSGAEVTDAARAAARASQPRAASDRAAAPRRRPRCRPSRARPRLRPG